MAIVKELKCFWDGLKRYGAESVMISVGEPLLHSECKEILSAFFL